MELEVAGFTDLSDLFVFNFEPEEADLELVLQRNFFDIFTSSHLVSFEKEEDFFGMGRLVEHLVQLGSLGIDDIALHWVWQDKEACAFECVILGVYVPESDHSELLGIHARVDGELLRLALANIGVMVGHNTRYWIDDFLVSKLVGFVQLRIDLTVQTCCPPISHSV